MDIKIIVDVLLAVVMNVLKRDINNGNILFRYYYKKWRRGN